MKSDKPIKPLEEICLPYILRPTKYLEGGVNGKMFRFYPGEEYEIDFPIFEVLINSGWSP